MAIIKNITVNPRLVGVIGFAAGFYVGRNYGITVSLKRKAG